MKNYTLYYLIIIVLFPGLLLIGCATPGSVNNLAEKTAANTSVVSAGLQQLSQLNRRVAAQRVAAIARMEQATAEVKAEYDLDRALIKKSGDSKNLNVSNELNEWMEQVRGFNKQPDGVEETQKQVIVGALVNSDTGAKKLAAVAEQLSNLAQKDNAKKRAVFFAKFAKEVADTTNAQMKEAKKAAKQAEAGASKNAQPKKDGT